MTHNNSTHMLTAAAAFGAAAIFGLLSFGSSAEAGNPLSCHGDTAKKVVDCCKQMTRERRPRWMVDQGISCNNAVVCRKGGPLTLTAVMVAKRCYVQRRYDINDGNGPTGGKRNLN